jgi:hypothetical protein
VTAGKGREQDAQALPNLQGFEIHHSGLRPGVLPYNIYEEYIINICN